MHGITHEQRGSTEGARRCVRPCSCLLNRVLDAEIHEGIHSQAQAKDRAGGIPADARTSKHSAWLRVCVITRLVMTWAHFDVSLFGCCRRGPRGDFETQSIKGRASTEADHDGD